MQKVYYDPAHPNAFGGIRKLKHSVKKVSQDQISTWLSDQLAYTLHKPVRKSFKRRQVIVGGPDIQWQADLVEVASLKNGNIRYLLTVIDVFDRHAWVIPLKDKTGDTVKNGFKYIFEQSEPRIPFKLQTDFGKEFHNKQVQPYLKRKGVTHFSTYNMDTKSALVERFNRTLMTKLWRYFTSVGNTSFLHVLPKMVHAYNNAYHRSIGMAPAHVNTPAKIEKVWQKLYGMKKTTRRPPRLAEGDTVRISKAKKRFDKGYMQNWTDEVFFVSKILNTTPSTYRLIDHDDSELIGSFYEEELQKVNTTVYRIEKLLKTRKVKGQLQHLVKWKGYTDSANSWIKASELIDLEGK